MKRIEVSMQDIWAWTKPKAHRNKKKYDRNKEKRQDYGKAEEERDG